MKPYTPFAGDNQPPLCRIGQFAPDPADPYSWCCGAPPPVTIAACVDPILPLR